MIPYELYKVIHLTSILVLFTGLSISFFGVTSKLIKVLTGVATLLTLVAGMGLMARIGISHGEPWPLWILIKMAVWFIIGLGGATVARRFPKYGRVAYFVCLGLFILAAASAVYKF